LTEFHPTFDILPQLEVLPPTGTTVSVLVSTLWCSGKGLKTLGIPVGNTGNGCSNLIPGDLPKAFTMIFVDSFIFLYFLKVINLDPLYTP